MASLIKIKRRSGIAYRVQFYIEHKRYSKTFPVTKTKDKEKLILKQARQFKKQIEVEVENFKAGFSDCVPMYTDGETRQDKVILHELTDELKERRKNDFAPATVGRNVIAMKNLMECLGQSFLVVNLNLEHIDQFKN